MPWLSLTLDVDATAAELVSEALLEAGAQSVSLERPDAPRCTLNALVAIDVEPRALILHACSLAGLAEPLAFSVARLEDEDWVRRTQAQFPPMVIDRRLWIVPTWHERPPECSGPEVTLVRLDPGLAFGTGSHASTRLALTYLLRSMRGGERLLDYGCGSGILGIAAAKLGASRVDAVDIDPNSVLTASENAVLNNVVLHTGLPDELEPLLYDLVVSNILAQPLIMLAPLLASRTAIGGRIALSGILDSQAEEVAAAYAAFFDARIGLSDEGWSLIEGTRR
jgi:ribosomal protein L11 methyltransferase